MTKYVCDTCKEEFTNKLDKMIIHLTTDHEDVLIDEASIDLCERCKSRLTKKYTSHTIEIILDIFRQYVKPKERIIEPICDYLESRRGMELYEEHKNYLRNLAAKGPFDYDK